MATIQLPAGSKTATIINWTMTRVQTRAKWTDAWKTVDYLEVLELSEAAAPTIPSAKLRWRAGMIKHEDQNTFIAEPPQSLLGQWVRIQYLPRSLTTASNDKQSGKTQPAVKMFVGQVIDQQSSIGGGDTGAEYVDQDFVAYGIEHLLNQIVIAGAYVTTPGKGSCMRIDTDLIFNERFTSGLSPNGNKSSSKIYSRDDSSPMSYCFDDGITSNPADSVWSNADIVRYLLAFYGPPGFNFTLGGISDDFNSGSGTVKGALSGLKVPKMNLDHITLYEALNRLIDRRRGLIWSMRVDDTKEDGSTINFTIEVVSQFDSDVSSSDGVLLSGNADVRSLDQSVKAVALFITELQNNSDALMQVGKITVEGEPLLVCFTLSPGDGTLVKGWTDAEETAYLAGANLTSGTGFEKANDQARKAEKLERVFTTFTVPSGWNWHAGSGIYVAGGATGSPYNVNPSVNLDGTLATDKPANVRSWGKRFEKSLPILTPTTDDSGLSLQKFAKPIVLLKNPKTGKYLFAHDPADNTLPACHVYMLDDALGIKCEFSPAYKLALNHFTTTSTGQSKPVFDWTWIVATVAVRTDTKLSVSDTITGRDPFRELRIKVPGAETWWVAPRTIIDLDANGDPVRIPAGSDAQLILRDDSAHLRRVLAMAKEYYGKTRQAMVMTTKQFTLDFPIGSYFQNLIKTDGTKVDINSVVTSRRSNFVDGTVSIQTAHGELDFVGAREDLPNLEG